MGVTSPRAGAARRAAVRGAIAFAAAVALGGSARASVAHPLHTTIAALTYVVPERSVHLSIRVFAEDFARAVARSSHTAIPPDASISDAQALAYVQRVVSFTGRDRRPLPLSLCGMTRANELLIVCLRASAPAGVTDTMLRNAMLFELFDDQVNVVQASYGTTRRTFLFTRGGNAQRLP